MKIENTNTLKDLDSRGWIPGAFEDVKAFTLRVQALESFFSHPPETVDYFLTDRDWKLSKERVSELYDAKPDWIVAHYDDQGLAFFQGAATWIVNQGDLRIPIIQLKKGFDSGSYCKIYSRDEVLAHEMVHAMRMQFDEPRFEEILAYKTSKHFYRRLIGPLFEKHWEATVFLVTLFIPIITEIYWIFDGTKNWVAWFNAIPVCYFVWLSGRLTFYHLVLQKALKRIKPFLKQPQKTWAVALRLLDIEIFHFAFSKKSLLQKWISEKKTLRWTFLKKIFFKKIHN